MGDRGLGKHCRAVKPEKPLVSKPQQHYYKCETSVRSTHLRTAKIIDPMLMVKPHTSPDKPINWNPMKKHKSISSSMECELLSAIMNSLV
ncbi:hypothetical protein Fmac_014132 [Flemingia macrophylla]|uniref:Uncharacterized protein n=1 Tax=Flemingia macrophylla TaxID=520843 RepID=A0ABD1MAU8_9FABA